MRDRRPARAAHARARWILLPRGRAPHIRYCRRGSAQLLAVRICFEAADFERMRAVAAALAHDGAAHPREEIRAIVDAAERLLAVLGPRRSIAPTYGRRAYSLAARGELRECESNRRSLRCAGPTARGSAGARAHHDRRAAVGRGRGRAEGPCRVGAALDPAAGMARGGTWLRIASRLGSLLALAVAWQRRRSRARARGVAVKECVAAGLCSGRAV